MMSETGRNEGESHETEATENAAAESDAASGTATAQASHWGAGAAAYEEAAGDAGEMDEGIDPERVAALEAENADVKDRLLRLAADMENLRRRTEREIKDARTYAVTGFAREMLSVADNLSRALDAVPEEHRSDESSGLKALIEGVEMTEKGLISTLEKHGVRKLDPEGQRFDPNFHQAMFEIPNPNVPNGTVLQVVQAGYAIGERVLRPAMVGVSKGGPKAGAAEAKPADATAEQGGA
ncbi:nucleotide exchange factor GrpE [Jiella mangrovi]|uniref:Protein GrpE n=1 Tax=Jiella mangrovi TaxID=2821407 RepID=A0ABS4BGF4_9HYPH|nr:nucleotide exchange factor GrpE [Jiella mangrovi]MBP0615836.1 nucleotide exchange factor GrpE [Jiella mangrovi]